MARKKKEVKKKQQRGYFKFVGEDNKEYKLTLKEKKFVESYLEFKGNGVQAIYEAGYNPKNARVASSMAYSNLTKVDIMAYVNLKLEEYGYTDENVRKQHLFLLNQDANLNAKSKAIDMYYKKFGKYAPTGVDITTKGKPITGFNFIKPNEADNNSDDKTE